MVARAKKCSRGIDRQGRLSYWFSSEIPRSKASDEAQQRGEEGSGLKERARLRSLFCARACQIRFCHPDRAKRKRATRDGKSPRVEPSAPRQENAAPDRNDEGFRQSQRSADVGVPALQPGGRDSGEI